MKSLFLPAIIVLSSVCWAQQPAQQQPPKQPQEQPAQTPPAGQKRVPLSENPQATLGDVNCDVGVDKRVIVMMAALNMAGYTHEPSNRPLSELRKQLRTDLKDLNPQVVSKLSAYFESHKKGKEPAAAVAPYLSLALTLNDPPDFTIEVPTERLPDDVRDITDFPPLLEEFYQAASFGKLLPKYAKYYADIAGQYGPGLAASVSAVIAYLHTEPILELRPLYVPRPQKGKTVDESVAERRVRRFIVVPDLLNSSGSANLRVVRDNYYLLLGPTREANVRAMRRGFLRFVMDPVTERHVREVRTIQKELKALLDARGDKVSEEYKQRSAFYLLTDSFVKATDARMEVLGLPVKRNYTEADAIFDLSQEYERGAVLVFHFYDKMSAYDRIGVNIRDYSEDLLLKIDFEREAKRLDEYAQRLARYKQAKLEATAAPAPAPTISNADDATVSRLVQADQLILARRYDDARATLQSVLKDRPNNARALFGMAEVTSKKASQISDTDRLGEELYAAVELYKQAADNASTDTEKWLKQRSYVSAGKILAFLGQNNDAAAAFELAIGLGEAADKAAYAEAVKEKAKLGSN